MIEIILAELVNTEKKIKKNSERCSHLIYGSFIYMPLTVGSGFRSNKTSYGKLGGIVTLRCLILDGYREVCHDLFIFYWMEMNSKIL